MRDNYIKEWADRVSISLTAKGMDKRGIELATSGYLDDPKRLRAFCKARGIDYAEMRALLDA